MNKRLLLLTIVVMFTLAGTVFVHAGGHDDPFPDSIDNPPATTIQPINK